MSGHGFTPEELTAFRAYGVVVARGMVDAAACASILDAARAELAAEREPIEYEAQLHYPGAPASLDAPGGHTPRRLLQACARHRVLREWGTSAPLASRLKQLLGPHVALSQAHHNCIMTKQPRYSSVTGWHQDVRYWSFERPELVSVWLALGVERAENGGLSFIPGTHVSELARERLDDALFLRQDLAQNRELISHRIAPALEPGDVVFFHCRTFHSAAANGTDQTKFSLVFTYHALDNRPLPGSRSASMPAIPLT